MQMHIQTKHLHIVKKILKNYPYSFYVFGSRATGKEKEFSDLDLCFWDNIPQSERLQLEEAFEESDLPFTVDLVHLPSCDPGFQKSILKTMQVIQQTAPLSKTS
jgi:uncharacterized protein